MFIRDLGLNPTGDICPLCGCNSLFWTTTRQPPLRVFDYNRNSECEIPYAGAMLCDNCNSVFPRLDLSQTVYLQR